jgi:hypothetical protein
VAHTVARKADNIMSFVTGFVVYDILFWSLIAILAIIIFEPGTRVAGPTQPKQSAMCK